MSTPTDDGPWLVVGLGNPGPNYAANRHNAGFMALDELASRTGARFKAHKSQADVAEARLAGSGGPAGPAGLAGAAAVRVVLAKPRTYMNLSGGPVAGVSRYYRAAPGRLVVVHDELDIPFGAVRLKLGGGDNGHNGLRSITSSLGTRDYLRVRVGIGRPPGRMDPADFVLRDFSAVERKELPFLVDAAADAVEMLIAEGLGPTQNRFHALA